MGHLNKLFSLVCVMALAGCGVKGRPLPPLNPAPLGRGEPTFKEATQVNPDGKKNPQRFRDQEAEEPDTEAR